MHRRIITNNTNDGDLSQGFLCVATKYESPRARCTRIQTDQWKLVIITKRRHNNMMVSSYRRSKLLCSVVAQTTFNTVTYKMTTIHRHRHGRKDLLPSSSYHRSVNPSISLSCAPPFTRYSISERRTVIFDLPFASVVSEVSTVLILWWMFKIKYLEFVWIFYPNHYFKTEFLCTYRGIHHKCTQYYYCFRRL